MSRPRAVAVTAMLFALAACGPSDDDAAAPDPSSPAPSAPTDLCGGVSAQQLSGWAGRPVGAATESVVDDVTECTTVSDDGAVVVTWQTQPAAASLDAEVARADADGLSRSDIAVGGEPAAFLAGTRAGSRHAKVVVLRGEESLYVDVSWLRGVGPSASPASLHDLAVGVADTTTTGG